MQFKTLCTTGIRIGAMGLGAMPLSLKNRPSEEAAIEVIHRALDLGVNFIDTADAYCLDETDKHHNEKLITKALSTYTGNFGGYFTSIDEIVVATKGGLLRTNGDWIVDNSPERLRVTIRESYEALGGLKPITLWQLHATDPKHTIEATFTPIKEAVDAGLIQHVGVSNFSVPDIERARHIVPIVSVQNQHNPWVRNPEFDGVLEYCTRHDIAFLPWSPVGGSSRYKRLLEIKPLRELAAVHNCSVYGLVLSWLRLKSPVVVPIPGASKCASIEDSVASLDVNLTREEMKRIDDICAGLRF